MAAAESVNRSPTIAIATTIAAAAPTPCRLRATPSTAMFGANRHSTEASMCSTMPAINGRRRPSESDSGPTISWPNASPASVPVSVSCATDDDTESSSAMLGSAGRYMSMVSGPSATSRPSTTIIRSRLGAGSASDRVSTATVSALLTSTGGDDATEIVSTA